MFSKTSILLLFTIQLVTSQKCLYHKQEEALECWNLTSKTDFRSHHLKNVTKLLISSSNLTYISGETLEIFEQLTTLMVSSNNIKYIAEDTFRKNQHLEYIDFSYNKIEYLDVKMFATNGKLMVVDFTDNQLKFLHVNLFKNLPLLDRFILNNNPIDYCELNTHFALLELNFRNVFTNIVLEGCSDYYEFVVNEKLEVQLSTLIDYLNISNYISIVLLILVLVTCVILTVQSKISSGWRFSSTYCKLENFSQTKLPQAV